MAGALMTGAPCISAQSVTGAEAPDQIVVNAGFPADRHIATNSRIELTFNRFPNRAEGALVVMIGAADLTALFERRDLRLVYRSAFRPLPSGESEVTVYLVAADTWNELARFPLRVLTSLGFTSASATPSLSMNNSGQLAEGSAPEAAASAGAPAFEDLRFTAGVRTAHVRGGWTVETQENAIGVTDRRQALRFGEVGSRAPMFDLADYVMTARREGLQVTLGNTVFGGNRHLMNGFGSRGAAVTLGTPAVALSLGTFGGSSVAGWSDLLGFTRPAHRISAGSLGIELRPQRPGALHLDVILMTGSLQPRTGFTQNALTDAERSSGGGIQIAASTPTQRLRLTAGISRSRFVNPVDTLLSGGAATVPVVAVTKSARYVESAVEVLQNMRIARLTMNLTTAYRHERVDPLYRSVAGSAAPDVLMNTFEATGSVGSLSFQGAHSRSHDNLGGISSILRTLSRSTTSHTAIPLASLLRVQGAAWPVLSYGFNQTHQRGAGIPVNSGFTAADVPDQVATVHDATAQWQGGRWRAQYRFNHSLQDNRQPGRESSDLTATTHAASAALTLIQSLEVGVDLSTETNRDVSLDRRASIDRLGLNLSWRPLASTSLVGNLTTSRSDDAPLTQRGDNTEIRLELSQSIARIRTTRGQLFVRFARQSASTLRPLDLDPFLERSRRVVWTLTSGLNLQLF
jgi:hypothetical protein